MSELDDLKTMRRKLTVMTTDLNNMGTMLEGMVLYDIADDIDVSLGDKLLGARGGFEDLPYEIDSQIQKIDVAIQILEENGMV